MIFIKNKDLAVLSNTNIEENILLILKKLVDLKMEEAKTSQKNQTKTNANNEGDQSQSQ
jgi:hypothetical protein